MSKESVAFFYEKKADDHKYLYFKKVISKKVVAVTAHFHNSIEIVFLTKGKCCIYINGNEILLSEGDCAFIDRFDIHYYKYFENSEYFVFLISEAYLDNTNGFNKKRLPEFLPKNDSFEKTKLVFESIYSYWESTNKAFRVGAVNMVLGMLSAQYPQKEREFKGETKVLLQTLMYINEHFKERITLAFLCKKFGYSKNYFSTFFNQYTGMNLREYINRRRIDEFDKMRMQNNEIATYVLAEKCGFENLRTFYRAYSKYYEKS